MKTAFTKTSLALFATTALSAVIATAPASAQTAAPMPPENGDLECVVYNDDTNTFSPGGSAEGSDALACGNGALANGNSTTAVGGESVATGPGATAFGWQSNAGAERA